MHVPRNTFARVLLLLNIGWAGAAAVPSEFLGAGNGPETIHNPFEDFPPVLKARQNDKVDLRILPLGASIMEGQGSTYHSGLRKPLRMALRNDGYRVNMVGTRQHGSDMTDRDHEATGGAKIAAIPSFLERSKGYKPNIVIINVGTNNANGNDQVEYAYKNMTDIVNSIWSFDGMADTCVVLSTLLHTDHSQGKVHRLSINNAYRNVVANRAAAGKCIYLADAEPAGAGSNFMALDQNIYVPTENPKIHPTDEGHRRFAYIFYAAIHRALRDGKVKPAKAMDTSGQKECDKTAGNGQFLAFTQKGSRNGDGIYHHSSQGPNTIIEMTSAWDRDQWRFARLFNSRFDDMVGWYEEAPGDHRFGVWKNSADGKGSFTRIGDLRGRIYCIPKGLHFVDVNADGLDDIVCVGPQGDLTMSLNNGDGSGNTLPSFTYLGHIKNGEASQDRIRLADIDGDGRVDYGVVSSNGEVRFSRNGGTSDKPEFWQGLGVRAKISMPENDYAGIRFADLNGDGRDDWMWMREDGQTTTYTNARSCVRGKTGDGLNVAWRQAFAKDKTSGPTHSGLAYMQSKPEDWRKRIHFARIYGTRPAFGNLGVKDYVLIEPTRSGNVFNFKVQAFKNLGSGGTKLEADGNRYCNMKGHADGHDDYAWIWSTGRVDLYPNDGGKTFLSPGEYYWGTLQNNIWSPPGGVQVDRKNIQLADWDGDGTCDIIWVDANRNNQVRVFLKNYARTKSWTNAFYETSVPDLQCNERNGIGMHDVAVQFADITGSGRADYLCISPDGLTKARLHAADNSWGPLVQIKFSEGADRANLRWADVNGDGRDDMLWVDKFNGNAQVWYNQGSNGNAGSNGGSHWSWRRSKGNAYDGAWAGTCQYFPDLDGNKRADLHSVRGTWVNDAETWFNPSCGLRDVEGDDAEGVMNPNLPVQPGNAIGGPAPELPPVTPPDSDPKPPPIKVPENGWQSVTCTHLAVTNTSLAAADRWDSLQTSSAWNDAVRGWKTYRGSGSGQGRQIFVQWVSDFFHGPENMQCATLTPENKCSDSKQCHDFKGDDTGPAAYFIYNSLTELNNLLKNFKSALQRTQVAMTSDSAKFIGIFAPNIEDQLNGAQIADIILLGWGGLMAPMWNRAFSKIKWSEKHEKTFNTLKDFTNDGVSNSITTVKDFLDLSGDALGNFAEWTSKVGDMVKKWELAVDQLASHLYGGTDRGIDQLSNFIANGKLIDITRTSSDEKNQTVVLWESTEKMMYGLMIPFAWREIVRDRFTFLADSGVECGKIGDHYRLNDKHFEPARLCWDNTEYFVLTAERPWEKCVSNTNPSRPNGCKDFNAAPGFDQLDGKAWGGVSKQDIVAGALATYKARGNSNSRKGLTTKELQDRATKVLDSDVRAPGIVSLPVCDYWEAWSNYWDARNQNWDRIYESNKAFPCNAPDE